MIEVIKNIGCFFDEINNSFIGRFETRNPLIDSVRERVNTSLVRNSGFSEDKRNMRLDRINYTKDFAIAIKKTKLQN